MLCSLFPDGALLLQPFANQATSGNARIKPDMIERVACKYNGAMPRYKDHTYKYDDCTEIADGLLITDGLPRKFGWWNLF